VTARYYRRVVRVTAEDSPNVRLARAQLAAGQEPTGEILVPGVLPWADYCKRRATWDAVRQCVSLDALFWEGADVLMFPPDWLDRAEAYAEQAPRDRRARAVGIDPGEGGSDTAMSAVDEHGVVELASRKTPDTSVVVPEAVAFMLKHGCRAEDVVFDRGGGGKQHADRMRAMGYPVRTVAFGESYVLEPQRGLVTLPQKLEHREVRYAYRTRRSQMYGELRELLDPANGRSFGLPARYRELRRQLSLIPLTRDSEGRLELLPKHRRKDSTKRTLVDIIGCSPDEADATVLAVHGMLHKKHRARAG
jgi:hypothetical protein